MLQCCQHHCRHANVLPIHAACCQLQYTTAQHRPAVLLSSMHCSRWQPLSQLQGGLTAALAGSKCLTRLTPAHIASASSSTDISSDNIAASTPDLPTATRETSSARNLYVIFHHMAGSASSVGPKVVLLLFAAEQEIHTAAQLSNAAAAVDMHGTTARSIVSGVTYPAAVAACSKSKRGVCRGWPPWCHKTWPNLLPKLNSTSDRCFVVDERGFGAECNAAVGQGTQGTSTASALRRCCVADKACTADEGCK